MNKKQYTIVGITILFFIIVILIILNTSNKKPSWITDIENADSSYITMTDCTDQKATLPTNAINEIFNKWDDLTDNGPWTGNSSACYTMVSITYTKEGVVKETDLLLIDNSSIVLNPDNENRYYTNASDLITYLNNLFSTYK